MIFLYIYFMNEPVIKSILNEGKYQIFLGNIQVAKEI